MKLDAQVRDIYSQTVSPEILILVEKFINHYNILLAKLINFMANIMFEKKNYLKRVTRVKKETFLSKSIYKLYIIRNTLSRKQIL